MTVVFLLLLACASHQTAESHPPSEVVHSIKTEILEVADLPVGGLEKTTQYSQLLVQDRGLQRSLYFVRDSGEVVLETTVDLSQPEQLVIPYTRAMLVAPLFIPNIKRSLLIGLGGGAMVHFVQAHWPEQMLDAVEIDPVIVALSQTHFGLEQSDQIKLYAEDGFVFIAESKNKYDVIYMDAFLKPSEDTDSTGVPLRLKTLAFYEQIKARLSPTGLVLFNINHHGRLEDDINVIHEAFGNVWLLRVPGRGNTIAIASSHQHKLDSVLKEAHALDSAQRLPFEIGYWAERIEPWTPLELE